MTSGKSFRTYPRMRPSCGNSNSYVPATVGLVVVEVSVVVTSKKFIIKFLA